MNKKRIWIIFLLVWSILIQAINTLLECLSLCGNQKAKEWTQPRKNYKKIFKSLQEISFSGRPIVLGLASSAGEYEQLLPVLERIRAKGWLPVIIFFSASGMRYAKARNEEIIWFPTPVDSYFNVKKFFNCLAPKLVIVARHELWPNFIYHASKGSRLVLIDGSVSQGMQKDFLGIRKKILSLFHSIHTVNREDYHWFKTSCDPEVKIYESGDTKYDRAFERFQKTKTTRDTLVKNWHNQYGNHKCLVLGSAWPEDVELALQALAMTRQPDLRLVVVPHQTHPHMIAKMQEIIQARGSESCLYSDQTKNKGVIVVDQMGMLFDLYDIAAWVWVGGALHHQVHNVLEPAVRGLPLAFGPRFLNSHEAKDLIAQGLVLSTDRAEELAHWIDSTAPAEHVKLLDYMRNKIGASEQIIFHTKVDQLKNEIKYDRTKNHHQFNTM